MKESRVKLEDGTTWPNPESHMFRYVSWQLRYGNPTKTDLYYAASVMDSFDNLVTHPSFSLKVVQRKISWIRKAIKRLWDEKQS